MLKIIIQPHPFKVEKIVDELAQGVSLRDIYALYDIKVPIENCMFIVNGDITYEIDRIPEEDSLVNIKAFPANDVVKNTVQGVTNFVRDVVTVVWNVGKVIGRILFGPMSEKEEKVYAFTPKNNETEQYNTVPVIYGTTQFVPSYGASDYVEFVQATDYTTENGKYDSYLYQLYVLGYKPTIVNNIKIQGNALVEREYVSISATFSGSTITSAGAFADTDIFVTGMRILIEDTDNNYGEYTVTGVSDDVLTCSATTFSAETATITLSYLAPGSTYSDYVLEFIDNGDLSSSNYPYQVNETSIGKILTYDIYNYFTTPSDTKDLTLNFAFLSGLGKIASDNTIEEHAVAIEVAIKASGSSTWAVLQNASGSPSYTYSGATKTPYRFQLTYDVPSILGGTRGRYDIRVKRLTESGDASYIEDLTWVSTQTKAVDDSGDYVAPVDATTGADLLLMVLRIKANDQLSGSIDNLTANVTRWALDYDADADTDEATDVTCFVERETHNPASMFIDVLTNTKLSQHPVTFSSARFDLIALKDWYTWCDENDDDVTYTCNGILLEETTVQQELQKICSAGRAEFAVIDGKYTVRQAIAQTTPVQLFTPRNILRDSFSVSRSYEFTPDGVSFQFINADVGYITDEIEVEDEYTTKVTASNSYVDNYMQAYALGKYVLNTSQYEKLVYQWRASLDALVATRGDRVAIQHDGALLGLTSGRVVSYTESGGLLATITTDEVCTMESGTTYGITIRSVSTIETYQVQTVVGDNTTLTLVTPLAHAISNGDLFSFGEWTSETADCLITDISYDTYGNASFTAIEYSDDVFDLDTISSWESPITQTGSGARGITLGNFPNVDEAITSLNESLVNTPPTKVFNSRPVTPYAIGDIWFDDIQLYDCIVNRTASESYVSSDWRLRSNSTFDSLNIDTFNEPDPEHRWQQIPGGALPYNLLATTAYTASHDPNTDKEEILVNDGTDWTPENVLASITVEANSVTNVETEGTFDSVYVAGRYENNGYMGEGFTNLITTPATPSTESISVTEDVTYVVQCYRGTISCTYGTASYNIPLTFMATATESLLMTISGDCQYASMTATDFTPPYVSGTFSANSDSQTISSVTSLQLRAEIVNIPIDATYGIIKLYGDADNYISLYLYDSRFYISILADGGEYTEAVGACTVGSYNISVDWDSGVTLTVNGRPYRYTETGSMYGYDGNSYGFSTYSYGFEDVSLAFTTTLATGYIGVVDTDYFNNTITEVVI